MAGNVLALWKPARPLARQNLADAIAAHAAAEQSLIDAKANVGRSMRVADESQAKRDAAVVALSDCKASLASAMAASTSSQATLRARDSALRQARADLDAADDHVEAAQSALGAHSTAGDGRLEGVGRGARSYQECSLRRHRGRGLTRRDDEGARLSCGARRADAQVDHRDQ